jgi:hypothetical protein
MYINIQMDICGYFPVVNVTLLYYLCVSHINDWYIMIKEILLKREASFGEDEQVLNSLDKVNYIYGSNGAGKTEVVPKSRTVC